MSSRWLILAALCAASTIEAQRVDSVAHVSIVGTDYAFTKVPTTLAPGRTVIAFENKGTVRHELSIARLRPGVTVQQILDAGPGAASGKQFTDQVIGILIARPGESSGGELLVTLEPGRRYLVICTLRDAPDAKQHSAMGMVASFEVR